MSYLLEALVKAEQRTLGDAVPRIDTHHDYKFAKTRKVDIKMLSMTISAAVVLASGMVYFLVGENGAYDPKSDKVSVESVAKRNMANTAVVLTDRTSPRSINEHLPSDGRDPKNEPEVSLRETEEASSAQVDQIVSKVAAARVDAFESRKKEPSVKEKRAAILTEIRTKIEHEVSDSRRPEKDSSSVAAGESSDVELENGKATVVEAGAVPSRLMRNQSNQGERRQANMHHDANIAHIPFVFELPEEFVRRLPKIAVSVHLYSDDPRGRILTVNNKVLHERDQIAPGLMIDRITENGMILSFENRRFQLDAYGTLGGVE